MSRSKFMSGGQIGLHITVLGFTVPGSSTDADYWSGTKGDASSVGVTISLLVL